MRTYECLPRQIIDSLGYSVFTIQDEHIELIRIWRNSQMDILRQVESISTEQQIEYFEECIWPIMPLLQPSNILLGFMFDGCLIGYGGLVHIAWDHLRAEVSFLLSPDRIHDTTGYARDFSAFLGLIQQLAFSDLKLHRLYTETFDIRTNHVAILEANGYIREGVLRDHIRIDGHSVNSLFHGLLNSNE
jgi:RimJ/RimL family protein N-acetyltransferase